MSDRTLSAKNPLLAPLCDLIAYADVKPEHIAPAVESLLAQARTAVEHAADPQRPATWEAIIEPMDTSSEKLWRAWSVAGHLKDVLNTPALRDAYNAVLPKVSEFNAWVGLHEGLYRQYQRLRAQPDFEAWPPVRQRIIDLALRDFRLSGVELQGNDRERYAEVAEGQSRIAQKFSENVLDASDAWSLFIADENRLDGIPADVREAARQAADHDGQTGWKLTLHDPCYLPVMQYAKDRELRRSLYQAYSTRASEQGNPEWDNSALIEKILAFRADEARLLGCEHYADRRLQTRMADSTETVKAFLRDLAARAKPRAERDLTELRVWAAEHLGLTELQAWDIAYASERLRESRYDYSEDEVKQYFTEPRVIQGLFQIIETLFDVRLRARELAVWHVDVRGVQVETLEGKVLGHLYLDLYARTGKQGGAWVNSERNRRATADGVQTPVVTLTCNFARPQADKPALLTHDDVITLFHEMGHALHALLGEVDEPAASAFSAVEWDAIELPSQFMENFCWEWQVLQQLTAHVDTGEPLPRELYERMTAARHFQSGMQAVRQIEFSLFDMLLHVRADSATIGEVMTTLDAVRQEVAVLFPPAWHRFPHAFSHIFAGGYGAGYYSYKWAEVLSADAYEAFEEAAAASSGGDTLDPATGRRFRTEILAVGGTRPAAESFHAFRGRGPRIDALLRHTGLARSTESKFQRTPYDNLSNQP